MSVFYFHTCSEPPAPFITGCTHGKKILPLIIIFSLLVRPSCRMHSLHQWNGRIDKCAVPLIPLFINFHSSLLVLEVASNTCPSPSHLPTLDMFPFFLPVCIIKCATALLYVVGPRFVELNYERRPIFSTLAIISNGIEQAIVGLKKAYWQNRT